ncbi:MAG: GntR family transcriptional regulator [Mesorhizobium sp.]|nr:MAG: GntR family transcriptional regulator [Mesorhizobium sp.]
MTAASPLQEPIRNQLRAQFFERIQVGERINEAEIAATLGVSRTPVRHALVQLQGEGVVSYEHNRGSIARSDPAGRSPRSGGVAFSRRESDARHGTRCPGWGHQRAGTAGAPQCDAGRADLDVAPADARPTRRTVSRRPTSKGCCARSTARRMSGTIKPLEFDGACPPQPSCKSAGSMFDSLIRSNSLFLRGY